MRGTRVPLLQQVKQGAVQNPSPKLLTHRPLWSLLPETWLLRHLTAPLRNDIRYLTEVFVERGQPSVTHPWPLIVFKWEFCCILMSTNWYLLTHFYGNHAHIIYILAKCLKCNSENLVSYDVFFFFFQLSNPSLWNIKGSPGSKYEVAEIHRLVLWLFQHVPESQQHTSG